MISGTEIKSNVKISPVGVIIAAMIKTPMIISARCRARVFTWIKPSLIRKKIINGNWNKIPQPRIHQKINSRTLLIFINGIMFSEPKEKKNFIPTGIRMNTANEHPIRNRITPKKRNGNDILCSFLVRPGPMNAQTSYKISGNEIKNPINKATLIFTINASVGEKKYALPILAHLII